MTITAGVSVSFTYNRRRTKYGTVKKINGDTAIVRFSDNTTDTAVNINRLIPLKEKSPEINQSF